MTGDAPGLRFPATTDSVVELARRVGELGGELGLTGPQTHRLRLAAEEIAMNAVMHGYGSDPRCAAAADLALEWGGDDRRAWVRVVDRAPEFDPTRVRTPDDLAAPLDDRSPGGLGIHLVRSSLDEFAYERRDGTNRTTLGITRTGGAG